MQTPVQIELEGIRKTPELQTAIDKHIVELEKRFGRVTVCRIVVKGPADRHQTGGQHEVSIRLALPDGRERLGQLGRRRSEVGNRVPQRRFGVGRVMAVHRPIPIQTLMRLRCSVISANVHLRPRPMPGHRPAASCHVVGEARLLDQKGHVRHWSGRTA